MEDIIFYHKHCALETSVTRLKCMARWTQRSIAPWYLFNSFTREAGCINIALGHSSLEATSEEFNKGKVLFDWWNGSWIRGFGNAHGIRVMAKLGGVTYWVELPKRPKGIKKDRTILGRLGLMVRPDGIQLDSSTWWIA